MVFDKNLEEAGDSVHEQAKIIVNRYNSLAINILKLENELDYKVDLYENTKKEMEEELKLIKEKIKLLNDNIKQTDLYKKNLARDFRFIIKSDSIIRLTRRVDKLKYEEYILRNEMHRLIDEILIKNTNKN